MRLVIGLAGLHGAGKSTLAKQLVSAHGFGESSFGGVVRREATLRGLDHELSTLQDLGVTLIVEWGLERFCKEVVNAHAPKSELVVIDGIRQVAAIDHIRKAVAPGKFIFLYVDIPEEERLNRLEKRKRPGDMSATRETHPVEQEVVLLRDHADHVIDGTGDNALEHILRLCN